MALVIPDKVLESNVCSSCNKIASVQPIKVYLNNKITCGRCPQMDDVSVVSLYNNLANVGLFKCINRFEGCRQLLKSYEVIDHERICESSTFDCPFCFGEENYVFLYEYYIHCDLNHKGFILDIPTFKLNQVRRRGRFLYKKGDSLFFICYELKDNDNIVIKIFTFSEISVVIKISIGSQTKVLQEKGNEFEIYFMKEENLVDLFVCFDIEITSTLLLESLYPQTREPENEVQKILDKISYFRKFYSSFNVSYPRTLQYYNSNDKQGYILGNDETFVIKKIDNVSYKIYLECCFCFNFLPEHILNSGYMVQMNDHFFNLCEFCRKYCLKKLKLKGDLVPFRAIFPTKLSIIFKCEACYRVFDFPLSHHVNSEMMCPLPNCSSVINFHYFKYHFKEEHDLNLHLFDAMILKRENINFTHWILLMPFFIKITLSKVTQVDVKLEFKVYNSYKGLKFDVILLDNSGNLVKLNEDSTFFWGLNNDFKMYFCYKLLRTL